MRLKQLIESAENKKLLNKLLDDNTRRLASLYKRNGYDLRIVGGAVRDILSGKEPKDIDLASNATPQESIDLLKSNNIKVIETGLQHGTITANMGGEDYEITTLRIDTETDGRHAKVEFTRDWELDAERRDLTFNAMSMDFEGNLYDYFGGHDDLKSGVSKFVGDAEKRIQEDYLRILRYFRFQARLDNPSFDSNTLEIIKNNSSGLNQISGERIWSEVSKILVAQNAYDALTQMQSTNVLKNSGLDNINLSEFSTVHDRTDDPALLLASLLFGTEQLDKLRAKWKFDNSTYGKARYILVSRDYPMTYKEAQRLVSVDGVSKEHVALLLDYNGMHTEADKIRSWEQPSFPISGNDLMQTGMKPGPDMGAAISRLKRSWAKSGFSKSKEELMKEL